MKKKIKLLLALVMSLTIMLGMSTTAFADTFIWPTDSTPYEYPESVEACDHGDQNAQLRYVVDVKQSASGNMNVRVIYYKRDGSRYINGLGQQGYDGTVSTLVFPGNSPIIGRVYYYGEDHKYHLCTEHNLPPTSPGNAPEKPSAPAHVHNFTWQIIAEPTKDADGLEGEVCSCGATRNTQPISVFGYLLNDYAPSLINAAKPGQTITFEFGEYNSFPKKFMAKLVDKSAQNVTFVFHYKWNHVKQEITIPAGTSIDLNFDWYGPAKMAELYGANKQ